MNILKAKTEIIGGESGLAILKKIEAIGRVCYKSEDMITEDSCYKFVGGLIKRGHEAMIEHGLISVKFTVDRGVSHELVRHRVASFAQESTRYCVAGSTKLSFKNPHNKMTIKELYEETINSQNCSWKRLNIKQLDENTGEIKYSKIKRVFNNGIRDTIRITTALGYSIECTTDHEIYTPSGYIKAEDLALMDSIYVNGIVLNEDELYKNYDWLYNQNITLNKTFVQIAEEFNFNVSTVKKWARKLNLPKKGTGYFNVGKEPWNKGLSENDDERIKVQADSLREYHYDSSKKGTKIMKTDTSEYQKYIKDRCEVCGAIIDLEVHHKDEDRTNNSPENLITLCESCHQRVHSKNLLIIHSDRIVNIECIGEQEVFDLEMDSINHNYIANGIVVHNCNYSKEKFGSGINVIDINSTIDNDVAMQKAISTGAITPNQLVLIIEEWVCACQDAERHYLRMIELGASPNVARSVLNNSTKTEITVSMNPREWRHFFGLRTEIVAHPAMREVTIPLLEEFKHDYPVLFDDIEGQVIMKEAVV